MKKTDNMIHLEEEYCKGDTEIKAIHNAMEMALHQYQWYYQNASETKFKTVDDQSQKAIDRVLELLYSRGQDSVASEVEHALYDIDKSTLTKSKVLTQVIKVLKTETLKCNSIKNSRYKNEFAERMKKAFIEYCEEFPLDKAPDTMDIHFTPWIEGEDMSR